jgi:hypothetical protein
VSQRAPHQMQAAQQQITLRPDSQMLVTAPPQRAVGNPDRLAYLGNVEWLFRVLLNHPTKTAYYDRMLPLRQTDLTPLLMSEAADQRLLQPPRGIRTGKNFRRFFRQISSRGV